VNSPIIVEDLSIHSGSGPVVDRVCFQMDAAEVVGLTGRSGSGKTTLAHALLGHTRPGLRKTGGTVRVFGLDPFTTVGARALRGRQAAYLAQDPASALNPAHRVRWHLEEGLRRAQPDLGRARRAERVAEAMDAIQLPGRLLRAYPHQLSGGQAARAALAAALIGAPGLLVLDEPTSGLDAGLATTVVKLLDALAAEASLLVISHEPELLHRLGARQIHLDGGHVTQAPSPVPAPPPATPATSSAQLLGASGISVAYSGRWVLRDVDIHLAGGECVALLGDSGIGKSTLARCLAGLQSPASGTLALSGRTVPWPVTDRTSEQRLAVAYVEQDSRAALNPRERVGQTLARARQAAIRAGAAPLSERSLLAQVALGPEVLDRPPGRLSGGQRQRVNLARALAACPRVLICDEVTASLDQDTEALVLDTLDRLRTELGLAVVLITHSARVAARAHRVHHLTEGILP
jgi:peptide/nickel transport system ATP-binding protein